MTLIEEVKDLIARIENGGEGSGDFDHAGRPGKVGGSNSAGTGRNGKYEESQKHLDIKGLSKFNSDVKKTEKRKQKAYTKLKEANDLYMVSRIGWSDYKQIERNYLDAIKEFETTYNIKIKNGDDVDTIIKEFENQHGYNKNETYFDDLDDIIDSAKSPQGKQKKLIVGKVTKTLEDKAKNADFDIEGYNHDIDISGTRHTFKEHGSKKTEIPRGQIPITDEDFYKIPSIIYDYDELKFSGKNKTGLETITYKKKMPCGTIFYVEEIRTGQKTLTINTMYKHKSAGNPRTSANNSNPLSNASIYIIPYNEDFVNSKADNSKDFVTQFKNTLCEVLTETFCKKK